MAIITDVFEALSGIVSGLLDLLVRATGGVVAIFWDTTDGFTIYGVFLLIGLAMFFVMFAWRVIQGFIRK